MTSKWQQHVSVINDNDMPLFPLPPASSSLKSKRSFGSSSLDELDYFGRLTTRLPTPPSAFPGNVADLGSSGTPSPKEEGYDLKSGSLDYFDPFYSPLIGKDTTPNKYWRDETYDYRQLMVSVFNEEERPAVSSNLNRAISSLLSLTMPTMSAMPNDSLRHHLSSAIDVIHNLVKSLESTQAEFDKKCHQMWSLQSCLSSKEREIQNIKQQMAVVTQLCDAQAAQLHQQHKKKDDKMICDQSSLRQTKSLRNLQDSKQPAAEKPNARRRASAEKQSRAQPSQNAEYRRKLDKNALVDWDAMIDKIIQRGDQQASLFLQQKLKAATEEQKHAIFESILPQAYPLMTSRFGNFLVQRLFEVGTSEQIAALIAKMQGRIVSMTCQPFGCHVLQKAFDCCPDESTRIAMVRELFENIGETITHKHACHIWQKVFEMQWEQQPPPVMDHVNQALKGRWTQVALDETGSLVIQHIFENVSQVDKRPVLDEVLDNIMVIARGQWGNWVVQHILEQAQDSRDREHAFRVVLEHAAALSMDQFASKVVEKALRTGGPVFLEQFMNKIMLKHQQRREPLIDMASDQYGNYVVQWLINHCGPEHQVKMCRLIKRHMVSLRGSKYGQRVAFLVEKVLRSQEITTYPGQS
ncbi:armadillo-type protein [Fennellomyces sp. T-0311]|nr:armadillo-type protein [Fennellomyces sp. T-0311]